MTPLCTIRQIFNDELVAYQQNHMIFMQMTLGSQRNIIAMKFYPELISKRALEFAKF